ncbi:ATP-binding protein [Paraglaciecola aquimarina]|uniref:histidine kinase n=1 Tax=Paraglaciecola aquimarina TaxID=1235557 RepID=A0ABU3SUG9_9ALTE|nr:ATP-binding protein [Paraglaciecola aquimarina]MDU0353633.1 ATP-binding protein [Paraglaciecola aquimarina]
MKKIYVGIVLTVIGSLVFLGWALDKVVQDNSESSLPADLLVYQKMMAGMARTLNGVESSILVAQVNQLAEQYQVDMVLEKTFNFALPQSLDAQLKANNTLVLQSEDATHFYSLLPSHPDILLSMTIPKEEPQGYMLDVMLTVILYVGIGLSLVIWLVPLTKRLSLLDKLARRFGQGQLDTRIQPSRFSYIDGIETSFNRMATQIETLVADNKLLAGSLSHDLRTPVSCLRFGIEAAIDCDDRQQKAEYLNRVEKELTRLEEMLEAFLEYASMERSALTLNPANEDLVALAKSVASELSPLAENSQQSIEVLPTPGAIELYVDGHWLNRALRNLVSNAMDYCRQRIQIELAESTDHWVIKIHDDGAGVVADKRESIFQAFVTANKSRSRQNPNFGLGLAIVKRVATWHGGSVYVDTSALLGGACFCLTLPKLSPLISK